MKKWSCSLGVRIMQIKTEMRSFLGKVILVVIFHHFKYIQPFPSVVQSLAFSLMWIPLYIICCFSHVAFNICSLCLIFVSLINMCLGMFLLGFILYGTLWPSWTWVAIFFPTLGNLSSMVSSNVSSCPFFLSYGTHMILMLGCLTLFQRFLRLSWFLFILFCLFCSASVISTILYSSSLIHSSAFITLLFGLFQIIFNLRYCTVHCWSFIL